MAEKNMLGGALAEVAGPLKDFAEKLGGEGGEQWLAAFKRFLRKEEPWPRIIPIDRTTLFDPVKLLGRGWTIDEQDERSLGLNQVDLTNVQLKHMLSEGESRIKGEEKLKRLKEAGYIRLDAKVFQTLWENPSLIPEAWKKKINGDATLIFFDGTILRDPLCRRCVLYLYWRDGRWLWDFRWLEIDWFVSNPSAVLASVWCLELRL